MARPQTHGRLALLALLWSCAGCAQLGWSSEGPGAPGSKNSVPEPSIAATVTNPAVEEHGRAEPFSASDRERITPIQPWVEQVAREHRLDPDLINGIIWVESRFVTRAKSPAGARGLMQLMPPTANAMARQMGRPMARVYDPEFNVEAGSLYLLGLLDRYDGDETLALAAYNAGLGNVNRWMREDGELPPRSLEYVRNVQRARARFVAMRQQPASEDRTMIAAAEPEPEPAAEPRVPAPPPRRSSSERKTKAKRDRSPKPEPATNPLAPSPDVYRPEPTPEPPLEDTPYPPREDPEPSRPAPASDDRSAPSRNYRDLPSVLD